MPDGSSPLPLELADALAVIDRLRPQLAGDVVLIGGQAIALWRARLDPWLSPEAMSQDAIASSDIDFTGSKADVRIAAGLLNGTARVAPPRTPTSESGMVTYADSDGTERIIDFLTAPYGLQGADVLQDAVPMPLSGPGAPMTLKVMHPLHCLLSRVSNTALANKQTALAERQLLTAILLVPAYGRAILDLTGDPRPVMETNEKVFDIARSRNEARQLYTRGIDITDAALVDSRLPAAHREIRLPQLRAQVKHFR
jgi:hypothetical protein